MRAARSLGSGYSVRMCYSAQILADYRKYVRQFGAAVSLKDYVDLFWRRLTDASIKIPKAMEAAFADPQSDDEALIKSHIDAFHRQEAARLEQELFRQRKRLADAERVLQVKATKAATESRRIAADKVEGTRVYNSEGEMIGKVDEVMIGKSRGKVAYAVM